jgi:hypothetical protein
MFTVLVIGTVYSIFKAIYYSIGYCEYVHNLSKQLGTVLCLAIVHNIGYSNWVHYCV